MIIRALLAACVQTGCVCFCVAVSLSYLVLLPSTFLVVVEHVFSDVLPLPVVRRHMVHTLLQALVPPPAGVQKQAQHQY